MNLRIQELADQADAYAKAEYEKWTLTPDFSGIPHIRSIFNEKFAELIVRECARVARATPSPNFHEHLKQQLGHTWDMASVEAGKQIVKHFGVEEQPICKHDWYSARNPVVKNGSVCVICGALDSREPEELKND